MNKSTRILFLISILIVLQVAAGCTDVGSQEQPTELSSQPTIPAAITPTPRPAQTAESTNSIAISEQAYISPSGIFQINLPEGWNCSESGQFQVNCESPMSDARLQARISSTGYELTDEALDAFMYAELVNRYGTVKEYNETNLEKTAGEIVSRATWREEADYWESVDAFWRNGRGVFHLTFLNKQANSEMYADLYETISDGVLVFPENITKEALYPFRETVSARSGLFEYDIPTSWTRFIDGTSIEKTVVEGYISPDARASVQIATYTQGTFIDQDAKGFNTREVMFQLYGYDLKNSDDRALPDGRERLTWYAAEKDINGVTDFDTYVNTLYLFTITWEPTTESLYLPVLQAIQDSFTRK